MIWTSETLDCLGVPIPAGLTISSIVIDTRDLQPGALFVAFAGETVDGHDFITAARKAGAAAALVTHRIDDPLPQIVVPDTLKALQTLGQTARTRFKGIVVGLTGSVGKTGTKEMCRMALSQLGETFASAGNKNNHIGVPLSLANLPENAAYAVFEMGMNHAGEILDLTQQVKPTIAIITNIGTAHIQDFKDQDAIAKAKAEIFWGLTPHARVSVTAIINRDDPYHAFLHDEAMDRGAQQILHFSQAMYENVTLHDHGQSITVIGQTSPVVMPWMGAHHAQNAMAVWQMMQALGGTYTQFQTAMAALPDLYGRGQMLHLTIQGKKIHVIDDAYNAAPEAMRAAIATLGSRAVAGRRLAILGEMRELGSHAQAIHEGLKADLARAAVDQVFAAGPAMKWLAEALPPSQLGAFTMTADDLIPHVMNALCDEDTLLVKGSNGIKISKIVYALKEAAEKE